MEKGPRIEKRIEEPVDPVVEAGIRALEEERRQVTNEIVEDFLSSIKENFNPDPSVKKTNEKNKEDKRERLFFHNEEHTRDVLRRVRGIFQVIEGGKDTQSLRIAEIAAAAHDAFQNYVRKEDSDGRIMRVRNIAQEKKHKKEHKEDDESDTSTDKKLEPPVVRAEELATLSNEKLSANAVKQAMLAANTYGAIQIKQKRIQEQEKRRREEEEKRRKEREENSRQGKISKSKKEKEKDLEDVEQLIPLYETKPLFTEKDMEEAERAIVQGTTAEFDSDNKTVHQPGIKGETSPVVLALALADLGGAGMDGPEQFKKEGDRLFFEENLDIAEALSRGDSLSSVEEEEYKKRIIAWSKFQISFAEGRKALFEMEILGFPAEKQKDIRALFSRFDDSIAGAKKEYEERLPLSFCDLAERMGFPVKKGDPFVPEAEEKEAA